MTPPYWTAADQAELDAALGAIIYADLTPEQRGPLWDLLESWIFTRRLLSKAEYLRRRHLEDFDGSG